MLPFVEPWVSSEDIDKGDVWLRALRDGLHGARFGIVCLFPESLTRPSWVVFEAGVIWHAVEKSRLAPLLVDVERGSLPGPLQIFQVTLDDKDEIRKLVRSINKEADEEQAIPREKFDARFEAYWPSLEADLNALRSSPAEESQPEEATPGTRPPVLAAEQIAILQLIDDNIMNTDLGLAAHLGLKLGKTNYFIDGLEELGYLSYGGFRPGQRLRYYVTSKGRKYLHGQNSFPAQAVAQPSELHTPQPVITGQPTEIQSAHTPIERIEAAQKPCLVPRQFPVYNPEIEEILLPEDQVTLQIENKGTGAALNISVYLQVPGQEFPEPEGSGPFQAIALDPGKSADTGIPLLSIPGRGPQRLAIYFDSVTGHRYLTSADMTMTGPAGGLRLTILRWCEPVSR